MVFQRWVAGENDEALRFGQEALRIARSLGDRSIEVLATSFVGRTHLSMGAFSDAATVLERNVELLEGNLSFERLGTPNIHSVASRALLADVLSELGRFDEAIEHAEAAVQVSKAADHPHTLCSGLFVLGLAHLCRGDFPLAISDLEQAIDLCRTWQIGVLRPYATAAVGAAYAFAGRADEALAFVADIVEKLRSRQYIRPQFYIRCGEVYLLTGRIGDAESCAREAFARSRRLGARGYEARALYLSGDVASTAGAENADGYYRQAMMLAEPSGMRPLVAHCHLGLGKLYRRRDDHVQAQEHLTTATAMYREIGMTYWPEQAEAELRQLG
jgi:tetratricopeptide (TPR) repeat protein